MQLIMFKLSGCKHVRLALTFLEWRGSCLSVSQIFYNLLTVECFLKSSKWLPLLASFSFFLNDHWSLEDAMGKKQLGGIQSSYSICQCVWRWGDEQRKVGKEYRDPTETCTFLVREHSEKLRAGQMLCWPLLICRWLWREGNKERMLSRRIHCKCNHRVWVWLHREFNDVCVLFFSPCSHCSPMWECGNRSACQPCRSSAWAPSREGWAPWPSPKRWAPLATLLTPPMI